MSNTKRAEADNSEEIDCYECQYTKHKTQKAKTWQDGIMVHNKTENKLAIYDSEDQDNRVDQMFKVNWKLYDVSETIHFPRHLCQIECKCRTPQKFIKQKYDSNSKLVTKKKAEEEKNDSPPLKSSLESKSPIKLKTPVKAFKRKKFQPPVAKPIEDTIDHFDDESCLPKMDKGYYSFGSGGFVNSRSDYNTNSYSNKPSFGNNCITSANNPNNENRQRLAQKESQQPQTLNSNPRKRSHNQVSKEDDQDVYEYFKKFKPNPNSQKSKEYKAQHCTSKHEGLPSDDEDLLFDKKINELVKTAPIREPLQEYAPDYSNLIFYLFINKFKKLFHIDLSLYNFLYINSNECSIKVYYFISFNPNTVTIV